LSRKIANNSAATVDFPVAIPPVMPIPGMVSVL
jgi:hypothetical protein